MHHNNVVSKRKLLIQILFESMLHESYKVLLWDDYVTYSPGLLHNHDPS